MAGIFSSTGGDSTPVGSSRRRRIDVHQTATVAPPPSDEKSTADISQLDVAVSQLSSMACDRTSDNYRREFVNSSSADFRKAQQPSVNGGSSIDGAKTVTHAVDLRQPIAVLQPKSVVKLQTGAVTTADALSPAIGGVIAPMGASKLVLSPTSAFTVAQGGSSSGGPEISQPSNGGKQRGRSAGRQHQQQQQGMNSVKRMAMLFEEPSKRSDKPLQPPLPASAAFQTREQSGDGMMQTSNAPAISSELFFFPSVLSPDNVSNNKNRGVVTRTLGVAQIDATARRSHSDLSEPHVRRMSPSTASVIVDRSASSAQMQSTVTFVTTKSAHLRRADDVTSPDAGGLVFDQQQSDRKRNLVVIGNDIKQATLTWSPRSTVKDQTFATANSIEFETGFDEQMRRFANNNQPQQQSWVFDKKVVQKSAKIRLPTQPTAASSLANLQQLTRSRDRLNFVGKWSDFDRTSLNRAPAIPDNSPFNSKNDSIETAMSALETAISLLGSAVASRPDATNSSSSSRSGRGEKRGSTLANRPVRMQSADRLLSSSGGRRATEAKTGTVGWTGGKFQEDMSLQTTLSLLDRTIVEIDSAISISDLTGNSHRSPAARDAATASTAVLAADSDFRRRSPTAWKSAGDYFGLGELQMVGADRRIDDAVDSSWRGQSAAAVMPTRGGRDGGSVLDHWAATRTANRFLAERTFDISNATSETTNRGDAHLRQVTKNANAADPIVSFRIDNRPAGNSSRTDAAPANRLTNGDPWCPVDASVSVRQTASPPASAGERRRAHPPLVKEDSFNRPDSPLFHETLPLPTESAIRRYRQQQGTGTGGSRSGSRSQQKQQRRRQSSSSDSDGGEQKAQPARRHHKMRSASAGARLQSRGRRSRDR